LNPLPLPLNSKRIKKNKIKAHPFPLTMNITNKTIPLALLNTKK
jgi:hypothetical protein